MLTTFVRAFPGKIFLLGEYSVLAGEPALLAAVNLSSLGFGSSTANWIKKNSSLSTAELWKRYRHENPQASGADLIAQNEAYLGKGSLFEVTIPDLKVESLDEKLFTEGLHVFSASHDLNRKLRTEEALKNLPQEIEYPKTEMFIELWKRAKDVRDFSFLSAWAQLLAKLGLETAAANADREFIQKCSGVIGVKGCGAGLNDVFIVAIQSSETEVIQQIERERNLKYLGKLSDLLWRNS